MRTNMWLVSVLALGTSLMAHAAHATPRHDICADLGNNFAWGVSSYSQANDWPQIAHTTYGVDWRFLYLYVVPTSDPPDAVTGFWALKAGIAHSIGAMPVFTFYELLVLGMRAGITGSSEASIVQQTLANPTVMNQYFTNFVMLLQTAATFPPPVLIHVEPDSWGFMMWAMGVDGNTDSTSIPVQVAGSGRPELAGFANNASGFGRALLALRDMYAPAVRMGWHASNFRVGTRPEVVASFYSGVGEWDVLVTDHPHDELDDSMWWLPWDETRVATNVNWFSTVSASAHLPVLIWQAPIGTLDWHLLGNTNDLTALTRFANAGVAGVMFELQDTGSNVDDFRASGMFGALGAVPPASSGADGTAGAMRTRVIAYQHSPLAWPAGSPCARAATTDGGSDAATDAANDAHADAMNANDARPAADAGTVGTHAGCGCRTGRNSRTGILAVFFAMAALVGPRRRLRRHMGQ